MEEGTKLGEADGLELGDSVGHSDPNTVVSEAAYAPVV